MARPDRTQLQKTLIGPAGEHYVLFRLLEQGILAALAPRGAEKVDILVLSSNERITATIQVKTTTAGVARGWPMNAKHETVEDVKVFYAFVDLSPFISVNQHSPVTYMVPSRVVAEKLRENHQAWLAAPGKYGRAHVDNPVRKFGPTFNPPLPGWNLAELDTYREKWDLLREPVP
jgi:hypothetical protein